MLNSISFFYFNLECFLFSKEYFVATEKRLKFEVFSGFNGLSLREKQYKGSSHAAVQ